MKRWIGAAVLVLGACSLPESFVPTEAVTSRTPEGFLAAEYDVVVDGRIEGVVHVWSNDAYEEDFEDGTERTYVDVGFRLESNPDSTLRLDPADVTLETITTDARIDLGAKPVAAEGELSSTGGRPAAVEVLFEAPAGVEPQDLDGFRVRWRVATPRGTFEERTPFLEVQPNPALYSGSFFYSPYYDPFIQGPYHDVIIVHPQPFPHRSRP
jgi:hypothetical protein